MKEVLPSFIYSGLKQGFKAFGQKMKGYYTNEAQVVGVESRTSAPVRIPRDKETLEHIQVKSCFPVRKALAMRAELYPQLWMASAVRKL